MKQNKLITKTYLYNFDPLKPHFYIVKLGFTGVYITFLISAQNMDCGYNLRFEQKYEKYQKFLSEKFQFLVMKFSIYLNKRVFVMDDVKPEHKETTNRTAMSSTTGTDIQAHNIHVVIYLFVTRDNLFNCSLIYRLSHNKTKI